MGHLSSGGPHEGGPEWRAPLLGIPKDMLSKALEWASVSIGTLLLGIMEGHSFLRDFQIKRYIKRYINMPCKRVSLPIGAPLGTWIGFTCRDFLREKESISGFLSWTQRTLRF